MSDSLTESSNASTEAAPLSLDSQIFRYQRRTWPLLLAVSLIYQVPAIVLPVALGMDQKFLFMNSLFYFAAVLIIILMQSATAAFVVVKDHPRPKTFRKNFRAECWFLLPACFNIASFGSGFPWQVPAVVDTAIVGGLFWIAYKYYRNVPVD